MKYLIAAAVAFLTASSAVAQTEHTVVGADPTPHYQVYKGDTLVLRKPMGRELKADGTRDRTFSVWIDRVNGRGFETDGATKLTAVGYDVTKGYIYAPLDAADAPVTVPEPTPAPVSPILASVTQRFGANLAGCYATVDGALCANQDDANWYTAPAQGFELFRMAFKDANPVARVHASANLLLAKGATVMFDRHEYKWPSVSDQVAYWVQFGAPYKSNPKVIFDLMNEPRGFNDTVLTNDWDQWARDTKQIIAGLRAAGYQNTIALEYPGSSGAQRFDKNEGPTKACESAMCAVDRIGGLGDANILFSPHVYWDHGSQGIASECDPYLMIDTARAAAAKRGYKLLLGEAAAGRHTGIPDSCKVVLDSALAELKAYPDTWFGVTWWGTGREWKEDYIFKVEPLKGTRGNVPHSEYLDKILGK